MRCYAEDRLELTDEVKRRDLHLARELRDRRRRIPQFTYQVTGLAQAPEPFMAQQHPLTTVNEVVEVYPVASGVPLDVAFRHALHAPAIKSSGAEISSKW
jgi:hypothetical protein